MRIVELAGGVGGAKLADGLSAASELTVVVNTGDDFEHLGLHVSPDLDTVMYTLAGVANPDTGWGRAEETWKFLETLRSLGGPDWFHLGDRDLALHVERTRLLAEGWPLSRITAHLARALGVRSRILPMSDDAVRTIVETELGPLPFQEYFVARKCGPAVRGFRFDGVDRSRAAPGVLDAIREADGVILGPSNPWVSLDPILAVPGIRAALEKKPVVGVSPIIGGRAVKGPAAKMFAELGIEPSVVAVADHFRGIVRGLVIDRVDRAQEARIHSLGMDVLATEAVVGSASERRRLADDVLALVSRLAGG
jgi:LPPG:FO 2-phospho-L-lactate transferase